MGQACYTHSREWETGGTPHDGSSSGPQGLWSPQVRLLGNPQGSSPHVATHRSHSCPCLSVMASGTTSASPGRRGMACGRPSRTGRSSALGRTWPPGTPSSQGACLSLDRSRWVQGSGRWERSRQTSSTGVGLQATARPAQLSACGCDAVAWARSPQLCSPCLCPKGLRAGYQVGVAGSDRFQNGVQHR